jgi:N-acetylglucosaminyl-diphospho-decaprenol L-rhamnosyltransferase
VNRGLAVLAGESPTPDLVLVSNPDVVIHPGAIGGMRGALEKHPSWAVLGPRIFTDTGDVYPSVRNFPSLVDAAGHALLAQFRPDNPYTRRYNPGTPEGDIVVAADWVSGSCFLARRDALEELGGFDEAYFMYNEDMDLCWRAHQAGWGVGFAGTAAVTHVQGVSTARHPYRMIVAHHRSALRFTMRTASGWRRTALPLAAAVLGIRMVMAFVRQSLAD